jgi:nucleotide-binding universal stress UspA family protein
MMTSERRPLKHGHISRVCVAVDATSAGGNLARFAISLVRSTYRAEIDFVHVVNTQRMIASSDRSLDDYGNRFEVAQAAAHEVVARCTELAHDAGVFARSFVRFGDPATEARRFARGRGAGLLVIGNRPTTKIHRLLNGSVRDDLVRTCPVPLLLAPHVPYPAADFQPHAIVVATAHALDGDGARRLAADLAADYASHLVSLGDAGSGVSAAERAIDAALREHAPGLLVMTRARRVRSPFGGDLVERVMQRVRVPLVIVRPDGDVPAAGSRARW